ncbi:MAG TPA: acyltransferase [Coleofasciculaceae cyanobacterium]|jgi:acetyltransferase-like isoleucine patch superfamily enzyme
MAFFPYTCLSAYGKLNIGKNCLIASHTSIYAHNHNFSDHNKIIAEQGFNYKGITIEDNCWLGSGVRVLDGVTIGRDSVIGSGAVVTKDIPPYSVAVGVPAKVISTRLPKLAY